MSYSLFNENSTDKLNNKDMKIKMSNGEQSYRLIRRIKDKTMNELRRDMFYEVNSKYYTNKGELSKLYAQHKEDPLLKEKNTDLHNIFYKNQKGIFMYKILEMFNVVEWIKVPLCFKVKIFNGRFHVYNGNAKSFIGETENDYYIFDFRGS